MKDKISVVINVVEAELDFLPRALASLKNFADEIVIVDMTTSGVKKQDGLTIYKHKLVLWVEPARNFGISKVSNDWILIMDPDEELTGSLRKKLKDIVKKPDVQYYRLPRKNIIFGKWIKHSRWWPDYNIRFFKKGSVEWSEIIHSVPTTIGTGMDLESKESNAIVHHNYNSVDQYITRMNRYTAQQADLLKKEGYKFAWQDLIKKPTSEFLSRYFQGQGYKDGVHGLAIAGLQAMSEFVLYLKTWSMKPKDLDSQEVVAEMKSSQKEFSFWQAEIGGFLGKVKRKLKLQ